MEAHPRELRKRGWMVAGFDTSMSSLAGAAFGWDGTLKQFKGPEFVLKRWTKSDHYFDRLRDAAKAHELIHELQHALGLVLNTDEIWIAQEEPWPPHSSFVNKNISGFLKQQAEISGAFLGGLVRYGYQNIWQVQSIKWRAMIAKDLGITTHHSKWRSPELALEYNCLPKDSGKFRSKQWALSSPGPGYAFMGLTAEEIPDWPDLIKRDEGMIPRPDDSKAKAIQPDDRYDALAIMWYQYADLSALGAFDENGSSPRELDKSTQGL
jgi:hypothetical protein